MMGPTLEPELSDTVQNFELNTVIFGAVPASYLATKCLEVLLDIVQDSTLSFMG